MRSFFQFSIFVAFCLVSVLSPFPAFSQSNDLSPIIEWDKRQDISNRLTAHESNLLGDVIDKHLGGLAFQHTDISLPGNSNLEVSLKRSLNSGHFYDASVTNRSAKIKYSEAHESNIQGISAITSCVYWFVKYKKILCGCQSENLVGGRECQNYRFI